MSIAIDLIEPASDVSHFAHPVTVTRPKSKRFVAAENANNRSNESSATGSASETQMPALQLVGTIVVLIACIVVFASCAWLLISWAGSAMDQLSRLSPNQIMQVLAGR